MGKTKVIVDSNVFVGLFLPDDTLHARSKKAIVELKKQEAIFYAINLVIQETATVISFRRDMVTSRLFYSSYSKIIDTQINLDDTLEKMSWEIFLKQTKKGTSFVDCANLAVIEYYKLDCILSFDTFYPKKLRLIRPSM